MQTYINIFLLTFCFSSTVFAESGMIFSLLSLDQATKKVIAEFESKVLSAKTESNDGKTVHVIKILTKDGRIQHLKVDADTGTVIK
ncbi:MAG: PepSY domain-containing protein [Methylococcales bacterium]|nr:PepSY domain-containing protein [Methylococcales bacterium]